jgi:hypothetical protein
VPDTDTTESVTISLPMAARLAGIGETTARELARAGQLPGAFRMGRRWLVHRRLFLQGLERLARGELHVADPDRLLQHALNDVAAPRPGR